MAIYKDVEPLEVVMYKSKGKEFDEGVNFILEKLDALPVADVVPVVRCKDCKHYKTDSYYCKKTNHGYCEFDYTVKQKQGYCSYGERRCSDEKTERVP
jgi:hypothetical protein